MPRQVFDFAFEPRFRPLLAGLGIRPGNAAVVVDDDGLDARFGPWHLATPWSNVKDVQVTRDYQWFKAIGPRMSFTDAGVTFGSTTAAGVCVCFNRAVPALLPGRWPRHPGMTVTVADIDGLAAAVRDRLA